MVRAVTPQGVAQDGLGRTLIVWRPWQAETPSRGWIEKRRQLVEFRANPRSAKYMFAKAGSFFAHSSPDSIHVLAFGPPLTTVPPELDIPARVITEADLKPDLYDTVILLYPDPLGLNWQKVEKKLLQLKASRYFVINGRGRIFIWNNKSRRSLAWRRWLSHAWLLELLVSPIVWSISLFLALLDGLFNRKHGEYS